MLRLLRAELRKYWIEIRNYYPDYVGSLITTYIFFAGLFLYPSDKSDPVKLQESLVGFLIWFFSVNVISESSATISEEKQIGTLEQILIKPAGIVRVLVSRSVCWTLVGAVENVALLSVIFLTTGVSVPFAWEFIPIILLTLMGLYGFGLILAGLTIVFTKTASFGSIIQYFLLFFTGSVARVENFPLVLRWIAKSLPLTNGIALAQSVIRNNLGLAEMVRSPQFLALSASSACYFAIGLLVFSRVYAKARRLGITKSY